MSVNQKVEINDLACNIVTRPNDILEPLSAEEASSISGGTANGAISTAAIKALNLKFGNGKPTGSSGIVAVPFDPNTPVGPVKVTIAWPEPNGEIRYIDTWAF